MIVSEQEGKLYVTFVVERKNEGRLKKPLHGA